MRLPVQVLALAALALAGLDATPSFAAEPLEGVVFQRASSLTTNGGGQTDEHFDRWFATPTTLTAHASAASPASDGDSLAVVVGSTIVARWDSAERGEVKIADHGWTLTGVGLTSDSAHMQLNNPASGFADWTYAFRADRDAAFNLDFDFVGLGNENFGLGRWDFLVSEDGGPETVINLHGEGLRLNVHDGGQVTQALQGGHIYRMSLRGNEGLLDLGSPRAVTANEAATFNWSITSGAVPEPSAWALSILGFGLAGATLRRRRAALA